MSQPVAVNIQHHQKLSVSKLLKHEILSFQSATIPAFGAPFSVFIRNLGGLQIHDAVVCLTQAAPISGLTGSVANYPNLNPASMFFTSYDTNINGITVSTHRPESEFILNNILYPDEQRLVLNTESGSYSSAASRSALNVANGKYYHKLQISLFDAANFKVLSQNSEVELKFNMAQLSSILNQSTLTGTGTMSWSSAEVLVRVSRLPIALVQNELSQLVKQPKHYFYHRPQYAPFNLASGTSNATLTLSALNGNISHLFFIVRPTSGLTQLNQWSFTQIANFEIKDASNGSLVGGRPQLDRENRLNHASRYWAKSSYLADYENGAISNGFVYLYSFSADPVLAYQSGSRLNAYKFTGAETLVVSFPSALGSNSLLEVFAFQESILEHNASGIKVLSGV